MRSLVVTTALLAAVACSQKDAPPEGTPQTPFGTPAQVGEYLTRIDPYVQEVGRIEAAVETALSSERAGSAERRGTGSNLADAATRARPQLQRVLEEFDAIEPPPLLAPFHRDVKKLMLVRLEAYATIAAGWEAEQAGREYRTIYDRAEAGLRDANGLIQQLNAQMARINQSLEPIQAQSQAEANGG
ncbi:MAG: hypothetical protein ABIL09_09795 [Gemmatimonadota bacterium]